MTRELDANRFVDIASKDDNRLRAIREVPPAETIHRGYTDDGWMRVRMTFADGSQLFAELGDITENLFERTVSRKRAES